MRVIRRSGGRDSVSQAGTPPQQVVAIVEKESFSRLEGHEKIEVTSHQAMELILSEGRPR
jgi:hypothetical protein